MPWRQAYPGAMVEAAGIAAGAEADTDVLIVGGGIAGCATAYYLAREGVEVVLIERGDLNGGASGTNGGSLHAQIPNEEFAALGEDWARQFAPVARLLQAAIDHWGGLGEELGCDLEVGLSGGLTVAETEAELRTLEAKVAIERDCGLEAHILSPRDLRALAPYVSARLVGAEFCPGEGKANPLLATPALARAAVRAGAQLRRGVELLGIERAGRGFVAVTAGGRIRCRRLVDAAGADCGAIGRMLGIELPVRGYPIHMNVTEPAAPFVTHLVYSAAGRLTIKQAANGTVLVGGGWPAVTAAASGHPTVLRQSIQANLGMALRTVPGLAPLNVVRTWAGVVAGTEDWRPLLGEVAAVPGFFVNLFPWTGFTAGPLCGRLLAELLCGRAPSLDISAFAVGRESSSA